MIAGLAGPSEALLTAGVTSCLGTIAFVTAPAARRWRAAERHEESVATAIRVPGVRTVVLTLVTMGVSFGILEVTMPALAESEGNRSDGGFAPAFA